MDNEEARAVLTNHLARSRTRPYGELIALITRRPDTIEVAGPSRARYQVEIDAIWDAAPGGDVRVTGCIDDGGRRAIAPMLDDFIIRPDGSFVEPAS